MSHAPPARPAPPRGVVTELPGPQARAEMARGRFDMQAIYRSVVVDDAQSQGCSLVDVDGNVFLDMFASFALGALGFNHPRLLEVARSEAFARAAVNPTSTPFVTSPAWFDYVAALEGRCPGGGSAGGRGGGRRSGQRAGQLATEGLQPLAAAGIEAHRGGLRDSSVCRG